MTAIQAPRPRRSVLYMPGSNTRALEKARELPADGLILDLEDSVAPADKSRARAQVTAALEQGGYGHREVVVRINGPETDWYADDIAAVATSTADAILIPKVESAATLDDVARRLDEAGAAAEIPIWAMAETPRGVLNLDAIAQESPQLDVVVVGTSDLAKALRVEPGGTRPGLIASLSHCVLTARAHGLDILDGVHLDLDDDAGLAASCEQGRSLGFDGKTLIHPRQIAKANEVFGVSDTEAATATEILRAWREARAAGQGVAVVDGQLIEQLHVDEAERVLALHAAIAQLGETD